MIKYFLLLLLVSFAEADVSGWWNNFKEDIKGAVNSLGEKTKTFFTETLKEADDLKAGSKEEFANRLNRTIEFLKAMNATKGKLLKGATGNAKEALGNIDQLMNVTQSYKQKLDGETDENKIKEIREDWNNQVGDLYNQGLGELSKIAKNCAIRILKFSVYILPFALFMLGQNMVL